jgi:hypothetical protein
MIRFGTFGNKYGYKPGADGKATLALFPIPKQQ